MKVPSSADGAALALALAFSPRLALAQPVEVEVEPCVPGGFALRLEGRCTPSSLVEAYDSQVFSATGQADAPCAHDAASDLEAKLGLAGTTSEGLCKQVYDDQEEVPYHEAFRRGGADLHFERMFYNGKADWQEEIETIYEREDGRSTSILKEDAEMVRAFHDGTAQGKRVAWPDLPNFRSSSTDAEGNPTCETSAAMCCWTKDRQANDGNGNCASDTYDENCVDKDPADNTDLCYVDVSRGSNSTGIEGDDMIVFPGDNGQGEGSIHCHGMAWGNDVADHTARYKANNLFYVSAYDHMYVRGYVKNVPGAPMCGCVEQMPTVSRSDCTQVDLTEKYEIIYDADAQIATRFTEVHVDFNACRGINNRNNDLYAYMARLYYEDKVTADQWGQLGRIITDAGCDSATKYELDKRGLTPGYDHDTSVWTNVAGRDGMKLHDGYGHRGFNLSLRPGSTPSRDNLHFGIIFRACSDCISSHKKIYYRRRTSVSDDHALLWNFLYHRDDGHGRNIYLRDFTLHSTLEDALQDRNKWKCPDRNGNGVEDAGDFHVDSPFYGECSPNGHRVTHQRSLFDHGGDKLNVAYYVYKPEDEGLEYLPSTPVRGRESAGGTILRDPATGTIYMTGYGGDVWNWDHLGRTYFDDFLYHSEPAEGDHTVIARVSRRSTPKHDQPWQKSGLMMRKSLEPNSAHASVFVTGSEGICFQVRKQDGSRSEGASCRKRGIQDTWLKLEKRMDEYIAYMGSEPSLITSQAKATQDSTCWDGYASRAVDGRYQTDFGSNSVTHTCGPSYHPSLITSQAVAAQSSTCWEGDASRAIDGGTAVVYTSNSVTHTCGEPNDWWKVDLGSEQVVAKVEVLNRWDDCCRDVNIGAHVEILDANEAVVATSAPIVDVQYKYTFDFADVTGRYVRIVQPGGKSIQLAEVDVLAPLVEDADNWWKLDLGFVGTIAKVEVINRRDECCRDRNVGAYLEILDESEEVVETTAPIAEVADKYTFTFGDVPGRYVRIVHPAPGTVQIAEVHVFAPGEIEWTKIHSYDLPDLGETYGIGLAMTSGYNSWGGYPVESVFEGYDMDRFHFPSAAPSVSIMPTIDRGYRYVGCYKDAECRDLPVFVGAELSHDECYQACADRGYGYFGLKANRQCHCGSSYGRHGETTCSNDCAGDASYFGGWSNCIYRITQDVTALKTPNNNQHWVELADGLSNDYNDTGSIEFEVQANNDAYIALGSSSEQFTCGRSVPDHYEIALGGWSNTKSVMRYYADGPILEENGMTGVLSGVEYRRFRISWDSATLALDKYLDPTGWSKMMEMPRAAGSSRPSLITSEATASQSSTCWNGDASRAIDGRGDTNWGSNSVMHTCGPSNTGPSLITSLATATQSSTCWGGDAARAIDSRGDATYGSNSITHTCGPSDVNYVAPDWWKVDLGSEGVIARVEVLNRWDDCCRDRNIGAYVEILGTNEEVVATSAAITDVQEKYTFDFDDVTGKFVRVVQPDAKSIQLAEVKVFAPLDGPTNWWKVDFGFEGVVAKVEVLNRGDSCCRHNHIGAFVEVLNESEDIVATSATITDVQDQYTFYFNDVSGRFVRIVQPESNAIQVAEVKAFAPLVEGDTPSYYTVCGSPTCDKTVKVREEEETDLHPVRCCADSDLGSGWRKHPQCDVWGGSEAQDGSCRTAETHANAKALCEAEGARLCTKEELQLGCTVTTDCNLDHERVWSSTAMELRTINRAMVMTGWGATGLWKTSDVAPTL